MCQAYQRQEKFRRKKELLKIEMIFLLFLPFHLFSQMDSLGIKQEPQVSISLDSAQMIQYNEYTTALEVVIRNILGIIEVNPSYLMEQTAFTEYAAHARKLSIDSTIHLLSYNSTRDTMSFADSTSIDFQMFLLLKTEFKSDYLFSDTLRFNYRWIRAGQGREAIIMVNNDKIYFLRRVLGFWKIYVWTRMDFFGRDYKRFDDN